MNEACIIFPHQLYKAHPALGENRKVYLVEETLFFNQYNFHKQKLMLHRASMKHYEQLLTKKKFDVEYIEAKSKNADVRKLLETLTSDKIKTVHLCDPVDDWLLRRLQNAAKKNEIKVALYPTPNFLNTMDEVKDFFDEKKTYFQTSFYTDQRKKRKILLTGTGEPEGGKWSFDAENRKKFPAKKQPPGIQFPRENEYVTEARDYIEKHFADTYGSSKSFHYPIHHEAAQKWLEQFLEKRFEEFGVYEDAIVSDAHHLNHSVLSPLINIGLLNPDEVLQQAIASAAKHNIPLNSLEGFVRQIMGWREFIRIVYEREGSFQRTKNYWNFDRKIPASFWEGSTGITPIDTTIKKILETGYCHHIERLMVLGNFMLLCEFDPDEVYRWFMEMFVDSYDWVMVPNVYGMVQFADGGLMTTKPYISGSNYILKMSDYKKAEWCETWDGLFWRFMHVHRDFFKKNPRLEMLIRNFDKMPKDKQKAHIHNAEMFLDKLDKASPNYES